MDEGIIKVDEQYQNVLDTNQRRFNEAIAAFEKVKELAAYLAKSNTFTKGFEKKNEKGEIEKDEQGNPIIVEADIAICLMAGRDLGLDPAGSLLLGTKLNQKTYLAILKGRALGLDPTTAMEKIVSIPTKGGLISYTMVDVITAKLIQGGVTFLPFIKNYAPNFVYVSPLTNEELDLDKVLDENDELKPFYKVVDVTAKNAVEEIKKGQDEGKTIISRTRAGYYTKAIFIRKYRDGRTITHIQRFSTLDAQRAGYLPVYDAQGKKITDARTPGGPWETNTPQMLANRVITIGGRIIGADLIHGIYSEDEAKDIIDITHEEVNK